MRFCSCLRGLYWATKPAILVTRPRVSAWRPSLIQTIAVISQTTPLVNSTGVQAHLPQCTTVKATHSLVVRMLRDSTIQSVLAMTCVLQIHRKPLSCAFTTARPTSTTSALPRRGLAPRSWCAMIILQRLCCIPMAPWPLRYASITTVPLAVSRT